MATLGLQILLESARELVTKVFSSGYDIHDHNCTKAEMGNLILTFCFLQSRPDTDPVKEKWMIAIMVSVTVIKFLLMVYCRRFKNEIVRAYAQDHFFDVITNSVGLVTAVLAIQFHWWIDPTGAIIVSW